MYNNISNQNPIVKQFNSYMVQNPNVVPFQNNQLINNNVHVMNNLNNLVNQKRVVNQKMKKVAFNEANNATNENIIAKMLKPQKIIKNNSDVASNYQVR